MTKFTASTMPYYFKGVTYNGTNNSMIKGQWITERQMLEIREVLERYDGYEPTKQHEKVEIQPEDTMLQP